MSSPNETLYFVEISGQDRGPYTIGQLRSMWQSGAVTASTLYSFEGAAEWSPLIQLREQLEPPPVRPPRLPEQEPQIIYTPQKERSGCTLIILIALGIVLGGILLSFG
jgi:hypothetical protein